MKNQQRINNGHFINLSYMASHTAQSSFISIHGLKEYLEMNRNKK